ncbi:acyltransferase [Sphingobium sp. H39-3-25]|uniref:acyltransferase family protein n=1 Tax=Sphingobium arseniciresistens TaxID=3030834 RepID=UPI0023B9AAE1|nr:acyltransferase [Sphingobium arseniciresistens]
MNRLNTVQALRAIAAWLVIVTHGALRVSEFAPLGLPMRAFDLLGALGVTMFFTLSGFIMVHISRHGFGEPGAPAAFLRRRIIRVVPLYWIMTALAAAMILKNAEPLGTTQLLTSLLFIPYLDSGPFIRPVLGVGWTLNYEMFFYLLFAASLFFRRGLDFLAMFLLALLVLGQELNPVWDFHSPRNALETWTSPLLLPFLLGMGLALVREARQQMRTRHPFLILAAGCAAMLIVQAWLVPQGSYPGWWHILALGIGSALAGAAILAADSLTIPAWLVFSGDASYSLYLVHPLLFGIARRLGGQTLAHSSPHLAITLYVAMSTVAGITLYVVVERPITRFLSQRRRASPAIEAAI